MKGQWLVSFSSSSSSSHPAKSDITGAFLPMCDTLLCGAHGPGELNRMGAFVYSRSFCFYSYDWTFYDLFANKLTSSD